MGSLTMRFGGRVVRDVALLQTVEGAVMEITSNIPTIRRPMVVGGVK